MGGEGHIKHVVTGGSGFLGSLIAQRLLERGHQVRVLDTWDDSNRSPKIEFVNCDITNRNGVREAMQGMDMVHHTVALVPLTKSGKKYWKVNVEGSQIAAEEAVKAGVKQFVHMSSSAIFGAPKVCPIKQDSPASPVEIYGRSKLASEEVVKKACDEGGVPWLIVRPRTILGAGRLGIFKILFEWIEEGRKIYVLGNGNNKFQFIHGNDLMDAYLLLMDKGKTGTFNIGTDKFGTIREGLEALIQHARTKSKVCGLPILPAMIAIGLLDILRLSPLGTYHYRAYHKNYYFDVEPLKQLGWKPKYSNKDMFLEAYDWYKSHKNDGNEKSGSPHRKAVKEGLLWILRKLS